MKELTAAQAAELLGVSQVWIRKLTAAGRLSPCGKVGNYNLYRRADVAKMRGLRPGRKRKARGVNVHPEA